MEYLEYSEDKYDIIHDTMYIYIYIYEGFLK